MASSWNRALNAILGHCWLEMKSTTSKSFNAHFLKFWSLLTLCGLWNCNPMWPRYMPGSRIEFQVFLSANWITLPDIKIKPKFHQDSTAKAVLVWLPDIHLKSVFQELIIFALAMQIHYINVNKQLWRHACVFGLGLLNSISFTDFFFLKGYPCQFSGSFWNLWMLITGYLDKYVHHSLSIPLAIMLVYLSIFTSQCSTAVYIEVYLSAYRHYLNIYYLIFCFNSLSVLKNQFFPSFEDWLLILDLSFEDIRHYTSFKWNS